MMNMLIKINRGYNKFGGRMNSGLYITYGNVKLCTLLIIELLIWVINLGTGRSIFGVGQCFTRVDLIG